MITRDDIEAFMDERTGGRIATYEEKARLQCMTPTDMVKEFAQKTGQKADYKLYDNLIKEEFDEWRRSGNGEEELKELADIIYVIYGYAVAKGYHLDEAVRRVHQNNLGRCIQPDGTVKRREDGKIIKDPNYPKVNLAGCY